MASAVAIPVSTDPPPVLTTEHIDSIAQTYDDSGQPVWVHDLWMRCVYRNRRSMEAFSGDSETLVSEIVDHAGRVVGHLTIGKNGSSARR